MPLLQETFPGPVIDATRWTETFGNDGASIVGVPGEAQAGYYPQNIDMDGDAADVDSLGKIYVPGAHDFRYQYFYEDIDTELPGVIRVLYIGWQSIELDLAGDPKYIILLLIVVRPSGVERFKKYVKNMASTNMSIIMNDPASGDGVGGLRISRSGYDYFLWRYNNTILDWVVIDNFTFADNGLGYVTFGNYVADDTIPPPPWISGS